LIKLIKEYFVKIGNWDASSKHLKNRYETQQGMRWSISMFAEGTGLVTVTVTVTGNLLNTKVEGKLVGKTAGGDTASTGCLRDRNQIQDKKNS
jgi:hypothetical protein